MGRFRNWLMGPAFAAPTFEVDRSNIDPAVIGLASWADAITAPGRVSRSDAIQAPAVKRSRDLICATIGGLPLQVTNAAKQSVARSLLEQPERNVARSVTMTRTFDDLLFEGVAWWRVTARTPDKYPAFIEIVHNSRVDASKSPVKIDGEEVPDADLIRFDSPNDPLLRAGARAIRTALQLEAAAYASALSPMPQGIFEADPDVLIEDDERRKFLADWRNARQRSADAFMPDGVKYSPQSWSPEQLQLIGARERAEAEIATLAGINSEQVNVSTTSRTYFNAFDKRKEFLDFTLLPYMKAVEDRLSMGDVTPRGQQVRFNADAFLRSDTLTRYQTYEVGLRVGALTEPEIRELEDRPPIEAPETPPAQGDSVESNSDGGESAFSDAPSTLQFDAPAAQAEFKVDLESRTIRGLAVPYGASAVSGGRRWSFSKGSLKFDDVSRVKFLDGHDWSKPIGRAVSLEETDAGLIATFKVVATPAGDEALLMASDLVKDGLSIGVALGGEYEERDGVMHALSAPLAEVSLTPCPAFDSARVTQVAASNDTPNKEFQTMEPEDITPETVQAPTAEVTASAVPATAPTAPVFDYDALAAAIAKGNEPVEGPEVVTATPTLQVSEPLPYRFDGTQGEHDLSTDLFAIAAGKSGSGEAKARTEKFMEDAREALFNVATGNVTSVNPNRQRPDLFADKLSYVTPLWNAIAKGPIADATPFVIPSYNTSSGEVADHTQGTEPTGGSYSTTSQTVTPGAVSGKYDVNREVVDAGGNPQVSQLIMRQVLRAYAEYLEGKAAALLAGLTVTDIPLLFADTDAVRAGKVEAGIADLQFARGGDRFDTFMLHQALYKSLTSAKDGANRPLYPIIGAQNSNGTRVPAGTIEVAGKAGSPAWALSGTKSYLFAADDVLGWASAPQEFRFEYQVASVTIGLFGYQATACVRTAGVRSITLPTS